MNILFLSNSSTGGYGYGVVAKYVMKGLSADGHNCINFGMQTTGNIQKDEYGNKNLPTCFDAWGQDILDNYIKTTDAELLITIIDLWLQNTKYILSTVKNNRIDWMAHVTVYTSPLPRLTYDSIKDANVIVAPSKFVLNEVTRFGLTNVALINHGVNLKNFKTLSDSEITKIKRKLGIEDKFVYLVVQRNRGNKNLPSALASYKIMIGNRPEVKKDTVMLLLSYPFGEPNLSGLRDGVDLNAYRYALGIEGNVKFVKCKLNGNWKDQEITNEEDSKGYYHNPNFKLNESEMNKLYNIADVQLVTSCGESFGLPIIEGFASGLPCIAPNFSSMIELISENNAGTLVDMETFVTTPLISDYGYVSKLRFADAMYELYNDSKKRGKFSENAKCNSVKYSWDNIIPLWSNLVKRFEMPRLCNYTMGELGV